MLQESGKEGAKMKPSRRKGFVDLSPLSALGLFSSHGIPGRLRCYVHDMMGQQRSPLWCSAVVLNRLYHVTIDTPLYYEDLRAQQIFGRWIVGGSRVSAVHVRR